MSWPTRRQPERSSPLHNFSLPSSLKWGSQKLLRCAKSPSASSSLRRSAAADSSSDKAPSRSASASADDFDAVRGKLYRDLRMAGSRSPVLGEEEEREGELDESAAAAARPWNLRMRRAACRAPGDCGGAGGDQNREASLSPMRLEKGTRRLRESEKRRRAKFSIELSREEVELDYLVMLGIRPPRRPKKRPKMLQKQLEFVFPGSWLAEITIDRYKVPDCGEPVKA